MDDAARKEALDLFEKLSSRLGSLNYQADKWVRNQSESWVKDLNWGITRVFGNDTGYLREISGKKLYYPKANVTNRENYFDRDRDFFLSLLDRISFDLRLKVTSTSTTAPEPKPRVQPKDNSLVVHPLWKGRYDVDTDLVFLAMPFSENWSDGVWDMISNIVSSAGMNCVRADETSGRVVMDDVWELICKAQVIIADLTAKNANVAYEVGLADVLGKPVILLSQTPNVAFDFLGSRLITYDNDFNGAKKLKKELTERLKKYKTT